MPAIAFAATFHIKDIINGNGLEDTTSTHHYSIRQTATTLLLAQKNTGRGGFTKIVYADGGSETCKGAGLDSNICVLMDGTLVGPNVADAGGEPGSSGYVCNSFSLIPYGHYERTIVRQEGGGGPCSQTYS